MEKQEEDERVASRGITLEQLVAAAQRILDPYKLEVKAYDSVSAARADIAEYLHWYNTQRPGSSVDRFTPDEAYFAGLPQDNRRGALIPASAVPPIARRKWPKHSDGSEHVNENT